MKCPTCTGEVTSSQLNSWIYAGYEVRRYECPHCHNRFNSYLNEGKVKFTVPKGLEN